MASFSALLPVWFTAKDRSKRWPYIAGVLVR